MSTTNSEIITEQVNGIVTIQLNRPSVLNAINRRMLDQLDTEVARLHQDPSVRIVVLTGSGDRSFCVGADLNHIATFTPECIRKWVIDGNRMLSRLANLHVPVIAAINGYTIGGGLEAALACDLRIADDTSSFSLPEITHGWFPGWGGTNRLLNIIGETRAKEMIFLGERIDATTALNFFGISSEITFIVEDNKLKQGKFLPGMKIPIKSRENLKNKPDCVLVLAWNFFDEIKKKNNDLAKKFMSIKDLEKD